MDNYRHAPPHQVLSILSYLLPTQSSVIKNNPLQLPVNVFEGEDDELPEAVQLGEWEVSISI